MTEPTTRPDARALEAALLGWTVACPNTVYHAHVAEGVERPDTSRCAQPGCDAGRVPSPQARRALGLIRVQCGALPVSTNEQIAINRREADWPAIVARRDHGDCRVCDGRGYTLRADLEVGLAVARALGYSRFVFEDVPGETQVFAGLGHNSGQPLPSVSEFASTEAAALFAALTEAVTRLSKEEK